MKINVPGLTEAELGAVREMLAQLDAKAPRNALRAGLYDAKHSFRADSPSVPPHMRSLGIVLGWPAKPVDILARRCRLEGFTSPDADVADLGVPDMLEGNRFVLESAQAQVSSLIHAVSWLVTTRGGAGGPPVLHTFRDALNSTGLWNESRRRLDAFLAVTARDDEGKVSGFVLMSPGENVVAERDGRAWVVDRRASGLNYVPAEPLAFKPRLGRPFGSSRISRPVISLTAAAVRTFLRSEVSAEFYSAPQRWVMGADESMFKAGPLGNRWQALLGGVLGLPNNEDGSPPTVGQFAQMTQQPHMDQLRQLAQQYAGETSIPVTSLGIFTDANPSSVEAYAASREDLIAEAEGATDEWGAAYARGLVTGMRLLGTWREGVRLRASFRNPRHESRAAAADAGAKQVSVVPWLAETEVGLELLGLSADQIERALAERRRAQARRTREQLLGLSGAVVG